MPLYHFHIVSDDDREHVGSIELPNTGPVIPAGLELATRILAGVAVLHGDDPCLIEATDGAGVLVYSFTFSTKVSNGPKGYVH